MIILFGTYLIRAFHEGSAAILRSNQAHNAERHNDSCERRVAHALLFAKCGFLPPSEGSARRRVNPPGIHPPRGSRSPSRARSSFSIISSRVAFCKAGLSRKANGPHQMLSRATIRTALVQAQTLVYSALIDSLHIMVAFTCLAFGAFRHDAVFSPSLSECLRASFYACRSFAGSL